MRPHSKGEKMNNMLKYVVYILFFLLLTTLADQDRYTVESTVPHPQESYYRQQQDPCEKTVNYLFTNSFADMPQMAISLDNHIACPTFHSLYTDAVDYYIYALRRIII